MTDALEIARRVEETDLEGLKQMNVDDVYVHMDVLLEQRPGPGDLYKRWEAQQWSATALDFTYDREQWEMFEEGMRNDFESFFSGFFVGEQAVTDTLSPLVMGAPDVDCRLFLSTQVVDEARHSFFFARFWEEVLNIKGFGNALRHAKVWTSSKAYKQVFDVELVEVTDAVRRDPSDYGAWVEGVTLYHLMVEAMLALTGQRMILRPLREFGLLPSFRAGFTAVTRDESRHVNFGVWAVQQAVQKGYEERIKAAIERSFESCLRVYVNPENFEVSPEELPEIYREDPRVNWRYMVDSLAKRLRAAGVDNAYAESLNAKASAAIDRALKEYEETWSQEHPVRFYERNSA